MLVSQLCAQEPTTYRRVILMLGRWADLKESKRLTGRKATVDHPYGRVVMIVRHPVFIRS